MIRKRTDWDGTDKLDRYGRDKTVTTELFHFVQSKRAFSDHISCILDAEEIQENQTSQKNNLKISDTKKLSACFVKKYPN